MRKQNWPKRDPIKNYFPLPNEIYDLKLSHGAIAVYSYLLRREDRKTYQCLLSYREIGESVGMCVTTVRKYVAELEERSLIRTERTTGTTKDGRKRNGRLLYHTLPQLTRDTASLMALALRSRSRPASRLVSAAVSRHLRLPLSRIDRASLRVSIPEMPEM